MFASLLEMYMCIVDLSVFMSLPLGDRGWSVFFYCDIHCLVIFTSFYFCVRIFVFIFGIIRHLFSSIKPYLLIRSSI